MPSNSPYFISSPTAVSVPFDNSTDGYTATDVQAAIEESSIYNRVIEVSNTTDATTTSGTDAVLTTMSITPTPGSYIAFFNSSMISNSAGAVISTSIYVNSVQIPETLRKISPFDGGALSATTARGIMDCTGTVTVTSGQTVDVRWSTSGGTATCGARTLILLRFA